MPKRKRVSEQRMTPCYHQKSAEVIVSRKRAATEVKSTAEVSQKDEGLNVRKAGEIKRFTVPGSDSRTTLANYPCEDKPEAESKTWEEPKPCRATDKDYPR